MVQKILKIKGTPPIDAAGTYTIKVSAKNDRFVDTESYVINVIAPDTTPDDFTLETVDDVEKSTVIEKNVVIQGITGYSTVSIVNGEYSISDSGIWRSDVSQITNSTIVKVRHTSSAEYSTETITTLSVGGKISQFISRTITDPNASDITPNQFTFVDITNTSISTIVKSNITIAGINASTNLSITNGEYSFDESTWSSDNTIVDNGQKIFVRHTSSNLYSTVINTILTVGGISDTFTSTTLDIPAPILLGQVIPSYEVNQEISLTLENTGGAATSWSIENKPDWMTFNEQTGELSGTAQSGNNLNIKITATNSSGSDDFTFNFNVSRLSGPNINTGIHTLDEDIMEFTFTDNSQWRDSITSIIFQEDYGEPELTLVQGTDYTLEAGKFSLIINGTNQIPTNAGNWQVTIKSTNYYDTTLYINPQSGSIGTVNDQLNVIVLNAAMRQGNVSTIEFQPLDRFGNIMKNKEVNFDVFITNTNLNFIEPYLIKGINEINYNDFINASSNPTNRHSYYTDDTGWVKVMVKVPGCIDVGDGFSIVLKDSNNDKTIVRTTDAIKDSLKLDNTRSECTDVDWKKRFITGVIYNKTLITDDDGNIYVAGNTYSDIEGTTNLNSDIYLSKIDRNGVTKWEKLLGTSEYDTFTNFILDGDNLYLSVTTSGSLDNNTNFGGNDAGLLKVSTIDGTLIYAKQVGSANEDTAVGVSKTNGKINLYATIDSGNTFIYKYNIDGSSNITTDLNQNLTKMISDNENNHISIKSNNLEKFDDNSTSLYTRSSQGGGTFSSSSNIDINPNNDIYITGQTKNKFYDEVMSNEDTYYGTIVKRNKDGNYQWSKVLGTGELMTTGGATLMHDVVYTIYSQRSTSVNSSPRDMYMQVLNDKDGSVLGSHKWEAGSSAYNEITASSIVSDSSKSSLYIAATVLGAMDGTNSSDGSNVIIKKQQSDTPIVPSGYVRNNYLNLVTDYDNNIQWVDDSSNILTATFTNAVNNCSNVFTDVSSISNWRVPTTSELQDTIDAGNSPAIKSIFQNTSNENAYWTNEETSESGAVAVFYWSGGGSDAFDKTDSLLTRCVRDN